MNQITASAFALTAPTHTVEINGRQLAYRMVGKGRPIVLCNRFRGILDTWDPAFIDALARNFTVYTFDYSGLGRSTGKATYEPLSLANDARDLVKALGLVKVVIGGWSLGGVAAQVMLTEYPEMVTQGILIGARPLGNIDVAGEQLFFDTAPIPEYTLEHETILFFEPKSESSRQAAARSRERLALRTEDLSVPIPPAVYNRLLAENPAGHDRQNTREKIKRSKVPMMVIMGDHDIIFPVENWYARMPEMPKMQMVVFSQAGHGPQHEFPVATAEYITAFVGSTL